jgi:hypothetical protein
MDQNIEWTWALGGAVLDEQAAVLDAIQTFRRDALLAGNLTSNEQQQISENEGLIEIAPADPEVIYIPYYEPERVVVVQPRPVVHFYSRPYPLYYYPYPYGYTFNASYFWGISTAFNIGWHSHTLHVYHHRHHAHPYYGRVYYSPWYPRYHVNVYRSYDVWQPRHRPAARPYRSGTRVRTVASRESQSRQTAYRSQSQPRRERDATNARAARTPSLAQPRVRDQNRASLATSGGQVSQRRNVTPRGNVVSPGNTATQARQNRSTGTVPRSGTGQASNNQRRYETGRPMQPLGTNNRQTQRPSAQTGTRSNAPRQSGVSSRQPRTFGSARTGATSSRSSQGSAARTQPAQRSPARIAGGGAGAGRTRR